MSLLEDDFPAGEKILSDIDNVLKNDPDLEDFFVIPVSENQNKSPVVHINHSLGLESWCIQHMYCYVYKKLMNHKTRKKREDPKNVVHLLHGALLINPETTSFWNMSKQLIVSERISPEQELKFTAIVLSFKPKCAEVFCHRKWILRRLLQQPDLQPVTVVKFLQTEFRVTELAANKYPSNYNAWNHRKWAMEFLVPKSEEKQILKEELKQSFLWTANHVSDFSGFQFRQYTLQRVFAAFTHQDYLTWSDWQLGFECQVNNHCCTTCAISALLEQELQASTDLITSYEGHESLWYHRRFILSSLQKLCTNMHCVKLDLAVFNLIIVSEHSLLKNISSNSKNPHQIRHSVQHENWLKKVLKAP